MAEWFKAPVLKDGRLRIVECRAILLSPYSQAICETDDASNVSAYRPVFVSLGPGLAPRSGLALKQSSNAVAQALQAGAVALN